MKTKPRRTPRNGPTFPHIISNSPTPLSRVLPEKLTVPQPVKLPTFYGTRKFVTAFTTARSLVPMPVTRPYPEPVQYSPLPLSYFLKINIDILRPSKPSSSKWPLYLTPPQQNPTCICPTYVPPASPISFLLTQSPE